MNGMLIWEDFDRSHPAHTAAVARIWNAACGADLTISPDSVYYNTCPSPGARTAGRLARIDGEPAGFVLATEFTQGSPAVSAPAQGWIDALAVMPLRQGENLGAGLLDWAERWLVIAGCTRFRLGAGLRPFAPGVPSNLPALAFFRRRGYVNRPTAGVEWDVVRDLRGYTAPPGVRAELAPHARPATAADAPALAAFVDREFPGRWAYEHRQYLAEGGRVEDFMILQIDEAVDGFCWLTFEDSHRPLDRFFMTGLPRPWGQLGPVGISAARRGGGWGTALIAAGLRRLRDAGVAGCVIDWTDLVDFYARFGFRPYRSYEMLGKSVAP